MILTDSFVKIAFFVLASIVTLIKIIKWLKAEGQSTPEFLEIQIRYFLCYFAANIPLMVQMPYIYYRYVDSGCTQNDIGQIKVLYNLSAAALSILVGPVLSFLGHHKLLMICLFISILASILRGIGGKNLFLLTSVIIGFSSAHLRVTFDDWFLSEENKIPNFSSQTHFIFVENFSLLQVIISFIAFELSGFIHNWTGTAGIFYFSAILQFFALFIAYFSMRSNHNRLKIQHSKSNKKDDDDCLKMAHAEGKTKENHTSDQTSTQKVANSINSLDTKDKGKTLTSFREAFKTIIQSRDKRLFLMILLDQTYGTLISVFWPCLPSFFSKTVSMPHISGMTQFALLFGTLFTSFLCNFFSDSVIHVLPVSYFLGSLLTAMLSRMFEDKFILYLLIFGIAFCEGSYQSLTLRLKGQIYPKHIRGYILGFNRLFQSLYSTILIICMEKYPLSKQPFFSACILFLCFILSLLTIKL